MMDQGYTEDEREELAYQLLRSLPRSRIATIQRRLAPLLQFDVVGSLPTEISLQIFSHLNHRALLVCSLVSKRWHLLASDQTLWKNLCHTKGWNWRNPQRITEPTRQVDSDDEGMGDSDDEDQVKPESTGRIRHSAPSILNTQKLQTPDHKLLHQTHIRLQNRFLTGSYRLSALQTRGSPTNAHTNTIYCLQLYTYPSTNIQSLFTGSRDKTVREWNITTGLVERVIGDVHSSSVLSICVHNNYLASAGSDRRVALWDLENNKLVKVISDHEDSVLCVRFNDFQLVSCSKDRTVRTYTFPDLTPQFTLTSHRAAVNAVSISPTLLVSASGDRSIRLWDAHTGALLRTFENHHTRGIASIDFKNGVVLSGSSDKHLRVFDITSFGGWGTAAEFDGSQGLAPLPFLASTSSETAESPVVNDVLCPACGTNVHVHPPSSSSSTTAPTLSHPPPQRVIHGDLVRSVALGDEFVVSGSYDLTIKVRPTLYPISF